MMRRITRESSFVPGEFVLECGHWYVCGGTVQAAFTRTMTHVRCAACEPVPVQLTLPGLMDGQAKREAYAHARRAARACYLVPKSENP